MAKIFTYRGKTFEEIQKLSLDEFAQLIPARERRTLKRGLTELQKKVLKSIKEGKNNIKTHARDMIIIPEMIGKTFRIHNGKEWTTILLDKEVLGHRLGELSQTRKPVKHSAPGIGATRSSASLSVK